MKKILFIIDPQNDFIEGGALAVPGALAAMDALTEHLLDTDYDAVFVSLDTHNPTNLGFKESWEGAGIDKVIPGKPFPMELVKNGEIKPKFKYAGLELLIRQPDFMCWPLHCVKGTTGHDIYPPLSKVLDKIPGVMYVTKGEPDNRDAYSIFHYGDGDPIEENYYDEIFDILFEPAEIHLAGLALDYCVYQTMMSLKTMTMRGNKFYLHTDFGAAIQEDRVVELYANQAYLV